MALMIDDSGNAADDTSRPSTERDCGIATVARAILVAYFDKLADTEGFADIAERLRTTVLYENRFSDAAIRAALFPDDT